MKNLQLTVKYEGQSEGIASAKIAHASKKI